MTPEQQIDQLQKEVKQAATNAHAAYSNYKELHNTYLEKLIKLELAQQQLAQIKQ